MNLKQVDYFLAVSETLNFTAAAKALYISQPALSKQITQLEEELDTQLFVRNKRSISLTKAGASLQSDLKEIIEQINVAKQRAWQIGKEEQDVFRIGCFDGEITSDFLPTVVAKVVKESPSTSIDIRRGNFKELRDEMRQGNLDILFTLEFERAQLCDYNNRIVVDRQAGIIYSKNNPLAQKTDLQLEDFSKEVFLIIDPDVSMGLHQHMANQLKQAGITPRKLKRVKDMKTLMAYIELGQGFTILNKDIVNYKEDLIVFGEEFVKPMNVVAFWKEDSPLIINILDEFIT